MRISYKVPGGSQYTTIYDQTTAITGLEPAAPGAAALPQFNPHFTPLTQIDPLGFSNVQSKKAIGNILCQCTLELQVGYSSLANALASIRVYAGLMNQLVHFKVDQDGETQYYPNALVGDYNPVLANGLNVIHSFQFTSDTVTATAPA